MPLLVNLFLPVQRQMVAVFGDQNLRQQSRRRQAAIQQAFRQRRGQRRAIRIFAVNVGAADGAPPQKPRRLIVQLLTDFLPDATPRFRLRLDCFRFNHFFHHRQVLR